MVSLCVSATILCFLGQYLAIAVVIRDDDKELTACMPLVFGLLSTGQLLAVVVLAVIATQQQR